MLESNNIHVVYRKRKVEKAYLVDRNHHLHLSLHRRVLGRGGGCHCLMRKAQGDLEFIEDFEHISISTDCYIAATYIRTRE